MPLNAKLVVVGGDVKTTEIKLRLPSTVGRGRGTTIMLQHPLVSRQHCELFEANGQLMVRDLGSLNGTFVNNQRISESPLPPGELLTIGTVTFRAMYEAQPESQPPPGAGPQLKTRRSETDVAGLAPHPPAASPAADSEPINFDEPVVPVDEDAPPQVTKRMETTLANPPAIPKTETVASAKTRPAPAKPAAPPPPAAKPAAEEPEPPAKKEAEFSKWAEEAEEEVPVKADEDDDLGDFLKSLGKK